MFCLNGDNSTKGLH